MLHINSLLIFYSACYIGDCDNLCSEFGKFYRSDRADITKALHSYARLFYIKTKFFTRGENGICNASAGRFFSAYYAAEYYRFASYIAAVGN